MAMFTVDDDGWIAQNKNRDLWELVREAIQNALDTGSSVRVLIDTNGRKIIIEDEGPGYSEIEYAWTVFGGDKGDDPTLRGRFSRGIKESITACEEATIETTAGTVHFDVPNRERTVDEDQCRETGTKVVMHNSEWKAREVKDVWSYVMKLWCPPGQDITVDLKGGRTKHKTRWDVKKTYTANIPTVVYDEESGGMEETYRTTEIHVKDADKSGSDGRLYEMGIPVKLDCDFPYYVDVQQRVPMAEQRNEPDQSWYQKRLLPTLVNAMFDDVSKREMRKDWFTSGLNSYKVDEEKKEQFVSEVVQDGRKKGLVYSTNERADDKCENRGYHVFKPERAGEGVAKVVKEVAEPSDQVAKELEEVREEKVVPTEAEREFMQTVEELATEVGYNLKYEMWEIEESFDGSQMLADYSGGVVRLNRLAGDWEEITPETVATALIHEPAHSEVSGHTKEFRQAEERIAGKVICHLLGE